jgi:hypothetical protein
VATSVCGTTATGALITAKPSAAGTAPGVAQPASKAAPSSRARLRTVYCNAWSARWGCLVADEAWSMSGTFIDLGVGVASAGRKANVRSIQA